MPKRLNIFRTEAPATGFRLNACSRDGKSAGHLYVYLLHNNGHKRPFALIEDIYIPKTMRGKGIGSKLIRRALKLIKESDCYKVIMTSRHSRPLNHKLFKSLGFKDHGLEFRMDFK